MNPGSYGVGVNPGSYGVGVNPGSYSVGVKSGSLGAGVNHGSVDAGVTLGSFGAGVTPGYIPPANAGRFSNTSIGAANTAVVPSNSIPGQHIPRLQPFPMLHNYFMSSFAVREDTKQEEDKI